MPVRRQPATYDVLDHAGDRHAQQDPQDEPERHADRPQADSRKHSDDYGDEQPGPEVAPEHPPDLPPELDNLSPMSSGYHGHGAAAEVGEGEQDDVAEDPP